MSVKKVDLCTKSIGKKKLFYKNGLTVRFMTISVTFDFKS